MAGNHAYLNTRKTAPKSGDLKTGVWYKGFNRVKSYALNNGFVFFALWTNNVDCSMCSTFGTTLNKSAFKTWAASSGVIFWVGCKTDKTAEEKDSGTGYSWAWHAKQPFYPLVRIYWKDKSGKVRLDKSFSGCDLLDDKTETEGSKRLVSNLKSLLKGYSPPFRLFSVTFKDWDGAVLKAAQTVKQGKSATPPADPAREGYTFTGWEPGYQDIQANTVCVAQYGSSSAQPVQPPPDQPDDPDDPDDPDNPLPVEWPPAILPGQRKILVSNNVSSWQMIGDASGGYNDLKRSLIAVTLGDNCVEVQPSCFYGCENLESVFMPATCKKIGEYAFYGCGKLKYVTCLRKSMPPVGYIGDHAFDGCDALAEIYLNLSGISYKHAIGEYCFANCLKLSSFSASAGAVLGSNMFYGCQSMTDIAVPEDIDCAAPSVFAGMENLKFVRLPASAQQIGDYMFAGDSNLLSVTVSDSDSARSIMSEVGELVFAGCQNLKDVTLPRSINSISCIDDNFLKESSVSCLSFTGIPDSEFTTGKTVTVNFGSYQTGVKYTTEKDVKAVINLAKKYNIPILMGMTNYVNADIKESPDYGYTPKGNFPYETCPHCQEWKQNVENTTKWKNWLKNSGYFYVVGGEGPFGVSQMDAKGKQKKNGFYINTIYRYYDAYKAQSVISKYWTGGSSGTYFIMIYYWKRKNGSVKTKSHIMYGDTKGTDTPSEVIKLIDNYFKGYEQTQSGSMKYEINKTLTTFGRGASCVFVSSSGNRYEIKDSAS